MDIKSSTVSFEPELRNSKPIKIPRPHRPHLTSPSKIAKCILGSVVITGVGVSIVAALTLPPAITLLAITITFTALSILGIHLSIDLAKRFCPKMAERVENLIHSLVMEVMALIRCSWGYFFRIDKLVNEKGPYKQPVVFVHGYMHNSSGWRKAMNRFHQGGASHQYAIDLGTPLTLKSIIDYAKQLGERIEEVRKETGQTEFCLSGHSMGGIVCAYYITYLAPEDLSFYFMSLVSPFNGTRASKLGFGKCADEMRYNSPLLAKLREDFAQCTKLKGSCHFGNKSDIVVRPPSSTLDIHHPKAVKYYVPHVGHLEPFFSELILTEMWNFYKNNQIQQP